MIILARCKHLTQGHRGPSGPPTAEHWLAAAGEQQGTWLS